MAGDALIDTGAILALLDRTDRWHEVCVDAFRPLRLPLLTSEAVLTELFHLIGDSRHEMETAWRFVRSGAIRPAKSRTQNCWKSKPYCRDIGIGPMDFADATLVHPARREGLRTIFTVDHTDIGT